jgi:cbb3-type cytochrome oxidase subunit 3
MTDSATFTLRPIPKAAFIAGYAGLLPQIITAAMVVSGSEYRWTGLALAYGYAAFIFSFIGGMWWALGATTRRDDASANGIFALAVAPSLLALATYAPWILGWEWPGPSMAWLGFFLLLDEAALAFVDWAGRIDPVAGGVGVSRGPKSQQCHGQSRSGPFAAAVSCVRPRVFAALFQNRPAHHR